MNIIIARKPLDGNCVGNVLKHGTGGICIDKCRVSYQDWEEDADVGGNFSKSGKSYDKNMYGGSSYLESKTKQAHATVNMAGRHPTNVIYDDAVENMFPETIPTGNASRFFYSIGDPK